MGSVCRLSWGTMIMPTLHFPNATSSTDGLPSSSADAPLLVTIDHTMGRTGWSRQRVYRLLTAGDLRAVKDGARTLIIWESVLAYIASLPPAHFRPRRPPIDPRQGELAFENALNSQEGSDV